MTEYLLYVDNLINTTCFVSIYMEVIEINTGSFYIAFTPSSFNI